MTDFGPTHVKTGEHDSRFRTAGKIFAARLCGSYAFALIILVHAFACPPAPAHPPEESNTQTSPAPRSPCRSYLSPQLRRLIQRIPNP